MRNHGSAGIAFSFCLIVVATLSMVALQTTYLRATVLKVEAME